MFEDFGMFLPTSSQNDSAESESLVIFDKLNELIINEPVEIRYTGNWINPHKYGIFYDDMEIGGYALSDGIAFWIPGKISTGEYVSLSSTNYVFKLGIASAITPLIYLGHALVARFLGAEANQLIEIAAKESKRNLKEGLIK